MTATFRFFNNIFYPTIIFLFVSFFFFQAEDGIRDGHVTGVQTCTLPICAPRGPVVLVANEYSGSDGDIVNAAAQALGVGPVVGVRTWGGVVGIDGRFHLVDEIGRASCRGRGEGSEW